MISQLSMEQILLLNNLMYAPDELPLKSIAASHAATVGVYAGSIHTGLLDREKDYGSMMTGEDWMNLLTAVRNDRQLVHMVIAAVHTARIMSKDGTYQNGGVAAVFLHPDTGEAVVAFRGTAISEWKDNFTGGGRTKAADGVSTDSQSEALAWYRSLRLSRYGRVTVTGHSKGGNKAKYITILDDSVDRCLSFDGQGFSDEFVKYYTEQIRKNQGKIHNYNVESDYVSFLLNDVGRSSYYKGYGYGKGGFFENHCPVTFFDFGPDGFYRLVPGERDQRMRQLDEFFNRYLRSLEPEVKQENLAMLGDLAQGAFHGDPDLAGVLRKGRNLDHMAHLLGYAFQYQKVHGDFKHALFRLLDDILPGGMAVAADLLLTFMDSGSFSLLIKKLASHTGVVPAYLYKTLTDWLKEQDVSGNGKDLVIKNIAEYHRFS